MSFHPAPFFFILIIAALMLIRIGNVIKKLFVCKKIFAVSHLTVIHLIMNLIMGKVLAENVLKKI